MFNNSKSVLFIGVLQDYKTATFLYRSMSVVIFNLSMSFFCTLSVEQ